MLLKTLDFRVYSLCMMHLCMMAGLGFICFYVNVQMVHLSLKQMGLCKCVLSGRRMKHLKL